jgi:TP901 family phage tail tape measure protein
VPVYIGIEPKLDENAAEKAAKAVMDKFIGAAEEINGTVGGILGKMFDGIDGSKGRNELKSTADEYAKTARAAADASRIQVSSAGNVEVAIKRVAEAHDKYGANASQTAAAENRLVNAWGLSSQAALDAAAAADVASQAHERVAESATHMNSSMALATTGAAALGLAVVETGKKLFDMGEQWAELSDKVTASTGKIGADAAAMTDQIADISTKTAAPIGAIADVYTQLGRLKDLQGQTLNDLTKQISDFDQMNKGDPLNMASFTRTMQEFHVPAAQVGQDLDVLNSVAQDARIPLNELVQSLQTAGPSADIAGLSFGQMANVLAAVDESGVNADAALKGFRMALGNVAADSKQLQKQIKFGPDENELQRVKDVIEKIQELHAANDDVAAIDLGKTVFGRSWADIGQAILDGKLNVDTLNTSVGQMGPGIEAQRAATKHFGDDWLIVKNQILDALKPLSSAMFDEADNALKNFSEHMVGTLTTLGKAFQDLASFNLPGLLTQDLQPVGKIFATPPPDSGPGPGSQREHRGAPAPGSAPMPGAPGAGSTTAPTAPNVPTAAPYHPLDLNPADKPPGAETYDAWINSQKQVQSALDRQSDTGNRLAAAQQKQTDLLASGHAKQEELNSASDELNKAQRDNQQATQDLTIAQQKYVEDADKAEKVRRGTDNNPFDKYDPFKEATKNSSGLIPQLASLLAAAAANQALGNPYGKLQAEKRGEDPSNPLYVSDVAGRGGAASGGGIPGAIGRLFQGSAIDQAQTPDAATGQAPSGGASPGGSIPALVGQSPAGLQSSPGAPGGASGGAPIALPPPGSGAAGWRDTVAAVVDKYGPAMGVTGANRQSWIDDITRQIGTESGGNPGADNPNDTNGQGGRQHVSGLLQYLPSSYAGSGGKLTGLPYMDPIGQIAGALFAPRNPDGSPNTGAPGGIGAGHGWGPQAASINSALLPAPGAPIPLPGAGPAAPPQADPYTSGIPGSAWVGHPAGPQPAPPPARPPGPGGIPGLFPPPPSGGPGIPLGIPGFAAGGNIAASDTQPAMLTPGEFVVKKDVAQKNLPALQAINSGQAPHPPSDQHMPTDAPIGISKPPGPAPSSRQPLGSVTPPPDGPRVGQGTGSGFGIGGGLIGFAENAAITAAMAAAAMSEGGIVGMAAGGPVLGFAGGDMVPMPPPPPPAPSMPGPSAAAGGAPGGGGGSTGGGGGAPSGASGDPLTAILNRTVGYAGQLGGIAAQGLMSSLIPGASQKGGIMDGGILSKLAGGIAGAHPSAPNSAGGTPTPLAPPPSKGYATGGEVSDGDTHVGQQTNGVHIEHMTVQNGQSGHDVANDLAFKSYAGYGSR